MHILRKEDVTLFAKMATCYQSKEEQEFFEQLRYKQEHVLTVAHDLILHEDNNEEGLYIVRCEYEEYIVGQKDVTEEIHTMCLFDALSINLKKAKLAPFDFTLLKWLQKRNFKGIEYNHNFDEL